MRQSKKTKIFLNTQLQQLFKAQLVDKVSSVQTVPTQEQGEFRPQGLVWRVIY